MHWIRNTVLRQFSTVSRSTSFNYVTDKDINYFERVLGNAGVKTSDLDIYNTDWRRKFKGNSSLVLLPSNAQEVSSILQHCWSRNLAVVPQGGNTGLVGGSVPVFDEIVVSLSRLVSQMEFNPVTGNVRCSAGIVLQVLDDFVKQRGFSVPLDIGAKGSCQIGGNIATNAGGVKLFRYGSLRENCIGVEAVTADGQILNLNRNVRKDNTGYNLKSLFVGSEGTLGVITGATIKCHAIPKSSSLAMLAIKDYSRVLKAFTQVKIALEGSLSAVEYMDYTTMNLVVDQCNLLKPFSQDYSFYLLLETAHYEEEASSQQIENILTELLTSETIADAIIASSESQSDSFWQLRHSAGEACKKAAYSLMKFDISIPTDQFSNIIRDFSKQFNGHYDRLATWGHLGDGNIHINVVCSEKNVCEIPSLQEDFSNFLYKYATSLDGSFSAEHGIGLEKKKYLPLMYSDYVLNYIISIKKTFDAKGILNPYKSITLF